MKKKIFKKYIKKLKITNIYKNKIFVILSFLIIITIFISYKYSNNNFTIIGREPLLGIDISNHQGNIIWKDIPHSYINFIFIKATEGFNFKDPFFKRNWQKSSEYNFLKGAYHFFKTDSPGLPQAENFINTVPNEKNTLPPVLDLETISGNKYSVIQEVRNFLVKLEKYYNKKPIIYVNKNTFETYIRGVFDEYPIWFADYAPKPFYGKEVWIFWQYTEKGKINGINGFIDLDMFKGSKKDLIKLSK